MNIKTTFLSKKNSSIFFSNIEFRVSSFRVLSFILSFISSFEFWVHFEFWVSLRVSSFKFWVSLQVSSFRILSFEFHFEFWVLLWVLSFEFNFEFWVSLWVSSFKFWVSEFWVLSFTLSFEFHFQIWVPEFWVSLWVLSFKFQSFRISLVTHLQHNCDTLATCFATHLSLTLYKCRAWRKPVTKLNILLYI